jgi:hypothetical protein
MRTILIECKLTSPCETFVCEKYLSSPIMDLFLLTSSLHLVRDCPLFTRNVMEESIKRMNVKLLLFWSSIKIVKSWMNGAQKIGTGVSGWNDRFISKM